LAAPSTFLANDKTVVDEAYAGDIIGIHDPGLYNISDTISETENLKFIGIPDFAPEHFSRVYLEDPLKSKQLSQGLKQLSEEGATQLFHPVASPIPVLGVVGVLQFDVIKFRLEEEYNARCRLEPAPVVMARWITGDAAQVQDFKSQNTHDLALDKGGHLVYLCPNEYRMSLMEKNFPKIVFSKFHLEV
jgi:peptide chain release factor 3